MSNLVKEPQDAATSDVHRVMVVTGSSSGLGRAICERMAARGWRVFATMRDPDRKEGVALRALAAEKGWSLSTPALDVTDQRSVDAAVAHMTKVTGGRVDVLVNNAGYMLAGALEDTTAEELAAQMETNVIGAHRVARAFLPAMRARGEGCLAFVGSISGRTAMPFIAGYHASKWALAGLVEGLRFEVAPFGLRVVLLEPGPFATDLHAKERHALAARETSPYFVFFTRFMRRNSQVPRGDAATFVACLERAIASPAPRLCWPVGPMSFLATKVRPLAPDWLYELVTTFVLGLRKPR